MTRQTLESALIDHLVAHAGAEQPAPDGLRDALWSQLRTAGWQPSEDLRAQPLPERSDRALLDAFIAGNPRAFDRLVQRHLGRLTSYARRSLPDDRAQEAAMDSVVVLYRKAGRVGSNVLAFLFGVLRLEIRKHLAGMARVDIPIDTAAEQIDDSAGIFEQLSRQQDEEDQRVRVVQALDAACNPLEQDVILMTLNGQDAPAIAAELALTPGHVRVIKHRAVTKLRRALDDAS